ncbi:MAG: hypothetical protein V1872_04765 [bacterium]
MEKKFEEDLPQNCPPSDAFLPDNKLFYRLVESYPPKEKDFLPYWNLYPKKRNQFPECIARAISVFSELRSCENIKKIAYFRKNNFKVISIKLNEDAGLVKQTQSDSTHFSWWKFKGYNPLSSEITLATNNNG